MGDSVRLNLDGTDFELPVVVGTENEKALDVSKLRAQSGFITFDDGYKNTGSCQSKITFINGEKGILRYRGYPIEELAEKSTFAEVAYLIIFGELPCSVELEQFRKLLREHALVHEDMRHHFMGFPPTAHPMAVLSSMINAASCYSPHLLESPYDKTSFMEATARLLSKTATIISYVYKKMNGRPFRYPNPHLNYTENFLHMMFDEPNNEKPINPQVARALDLILILHADHEQNCSTSTVRMVGSSRANLFASVASGVCALWGPLHGGANAAVVRMLEDIHTSGMSIEQCVARAKDKDDDFRLMGFGHRVYKNFDPRAKILKKSADQVLSSLNREDPLLEIAKALEDAALEDEYFVERKLYPNVDFYSGILMRAMGIPVSMFTTIFAMGRMPGWIANWREVHQNPHQAIYRPRQVYQGPTERHYVPIEGR